MPQCCQNIIIRKRLRNRSTALGRWLRSFLHLLFKLTKCVQMRHLITEYQFSFSHIALHSHTLEELNFLPSCGWMLVWNAQFIFGKERVKGASEPDFMGPSFMRHQVFLKHFYAINAASFILYLKSHQWDTARDCVHSVQAAWDS